jgi:hypothetical protein
MNEMMMDFLQVAQVVLFFLPVLTLVILGAVILLRSVSVIHQKWYLGVFLPLLLATPLSLLENYLVGENAGLMDWRFWLIVAADLLLIVLVFYMLRGWVVYGLPLGAVQGLTAQTLSEQNLAATMVPGQKRSLWGNTLAAIIFQAAGKQGTDEIWLTERYHEVVLRASSRGAVGMLRPLIKALRQQSPPYDLRRHAVGILFILLGVVLAVFGWIFFFEPRLILV